MRRDEKGYIVVETIGCFILFLFLNASILSLINIVTIQARVHYAMTQAAEAVSMYTYTLDTLGFAEHIVDGAKKLRPRKENSTRSKIMSRNLSALSINRVFLTRWTKERL